MALSADHPRRLIGRATAWPRSSLSHTPRVRADETELGSAIERLASQWPTYGYRRLTALLCREGRLVNGKRLARLMGWMGLAGRPPQRTPRTTDSRHDFPRFANLVEGLAVESPEQVWVADITDVRLPSDFVDLAVVMDVFPRVSRGWELSRSLDGALTLSALRRALRIARPRIHHSDQGVQYAAADYVEQLRRRGVSISMAAVGVPEENGDAERLMRTIKEEEVALSDYRDFADARRQLGRFLDEVDNHKRIHSALGDLTPAEFAERWKADRGRV